MKDKEYLVNLYLEQIKYLREENISIQNNFLVGKTIPLTALGLIIYYIESSDKNLNFIYLILPFLFFGVPYNVIKYTIRMMGINGYTKYLEEQINSLIGKKVFRWNSQLINCGCFGGFAFITTLAQLPINFIVVAFLIIKFFDVQKTDQIFLNFHKILTICLVLEIIIMIFMLIDLALIQKNVLKMLKKKKKKKHLKNEGFPNFMADLKK